MTGIRQVPGRITEQLAAELGTDSYEVTYHVGARPSHQPWQGKVWTMEQLQSVCGLGTVTGLHGANCYHDYSAFIPGVSVRTYTDEQLMEMIAAENKPKEYLGKKYTTYEALQRQRQLETTMRKYRRDIKLLKEGDGTKESVILKKARYQGVMREYEAFSGNMGLPMQKKRIYQDGLGRSGSGRKIPGWDPVVKEALRVFSKQEISVLAEETKKIVQTHVNTPSKWSGNIVLDPPERIYGKLWNCDISTMSETAPHILLHEQLHACSISYFNYEVYQEYQKIEEACVQLAAQEISFKEKIPIIESQYDDMADALRKINRRFGICKDDYEFSIKMIEMSVPDRLDWIKEKAFAKIQNDGTVEDAQILLDALSYLE